MRGDHARPLVEAFRAHQPDQIKVPAVVAAELYLGALKCSSVRTAQKAVEAFLEPYEIVPFDLQAAEVYADTRHVLEKAGNLIGPNDLIIASTVVSRRGILVTHNLKEFSRVPGLKAQDWTR